MNEPEVLTPEEIVILKEVAQDRMAVSRVWGKTKNFALGVVAILTGYLLVVENGLDWLRIKLGL